MSVTLDHYDVTNHVPYYRITGSFLDQPVDLITSNPDVDDLFLDQVIVLNLNRRRTRRAAHRDADPSAR